MSDVKKFYVTDYETDYANGKRGQVLVVKASDYAALEAELARLRAGQEPVATVRTVPGTDWKCLDFAAGFSLQDQDELTKLYTDPQPSAVPDGWKLVPVEPTEEMRAAGSKFDYLCNGIYKAMLAAAPSTPATVPVNQQLLEALENMLAAFDNPILRRKLSSEFNQQAIEEARAAIAAARQEGGKV